MNDKDELSVIYKGHVVTGIPFKEGYLMEVSDKVYEWVSEEEYEHLVIATPDIIAHLKQTELQEIIVEQKNTVEINGSPYMVGVLNGLLLAESTIYDKQYAPWQIATQN